jgi:hypothetical protein
MSIAELINRLTPYAGRLLDADYVHEQVTGALSSLRKRSRRANRKGARRAATDPGVLKQVGAAAVAAMEVIRVLQQPERPKRHRVRMIALVLVAAGIAAVAYRQVAGEGSRGHHG